MGRGRKQIGVLTPQRADERASIGDVHVSNAGDALNRTCAATVAEMTHYGRTREQTLPMLFRDDDLDKLKQVRGMVKTASDTRSYQIQPNVTLNIDYEGALVPAIEGARLYMQPNRVGPLLTYIAEVKAIHDRFEEVKAVLRYLNRQATPGAIRYYWPSALKLCPNTTAFADLVEVPSRYTIPPKIGDWMQCLKDAATTVTGSLMLPATAKARTRDKMWLTFPSTTVRLTLDARYDTDHMHYFI